MGVYDRPIATAKRLIAKYGEDCLWQKPGEKDVSAKPWVGTSENAPDPTPVKIAFFPNGGDNSLAAVIAALGDTDTNIASEYGLMPAVDFDPATSDTLTDSNGNNVEIVKMTPLRPNGQIILWKLWIER
ncbi:putative tail protein [Sphingomonas phage Eidolon]|uniref:Putative tail protein n=1 Tax=Sphingomonas phage Eidolon TaxID=2686311 RepID=A0A6M3TCH7_9CAUD|nr:putative tail protein [Sphingomonas phage Eidolon]QJD54395.1 putative tail protein [Sphingomonas phage Eidolon]